MSNKTEREALYEEIKNNLAFEINAQKEFVNKYKNTRNIDEAILVALKFFRNNQNNNRLFGENVPTLGYLISKLSTDELKMEQFEYLKDLLFIGDAFETMFSFKEIDNTICILERIKPRSMTDFLDIEDFISWYDSTHLRNSFDRIINSENDEKKIRFIDAWWNAFGNRTWDNELIDVMMINQIQNEELKLEQIGKHFEMFAYSNFDYYMLTTYDIEKGYIDVEKMIEFCNTYILDNSDLRRILINNISNIGFSLQGDEKNCLRKTKKGINLPVFILLKVRDELDLKKDDIAEEIYVNEYIESIVEKYLKHENYDFFNAEMNRDVVTALLSSSYKERASFLKFAKALGCFSDKKMLDKNGNETEVILGQKATTTLRDILKSGQLQIGEFYELFDDLSFNVIPNQDFLKFISEQEGKKNNKRYSNLELLKSLEGKYPMIFSNIMMNFDKVKELRESLDENGKPIRVSWREASEKYLFNYRYEGMTKDNKDIADLFLSKGLGKSLFKKACVLREKASSTGVNEHILGVPLKEETILGDIEKIKTQTEAELMRGKKNIEDLRRKRFTFEWLSKNDPTNSIIGLFSDCCATISSRAYGRDIAIASVIAPDVQNLVIRENGRDGEEGKIISKGTIYVNEQEGYAVINDFELNNKFKKHECGKGRYRVKEDSKEESEREQIFEAYQRGIQAFIEEYDRQHPDNPLKQINVGWEYNRLKRQVERFKKATQKLSVPAKYNFQDTTVRQYVLYKRGENVIKEDAEKSDGGER